MLGDLCVLTALFLGVWLYTQMLWWDMYPKTAADRYSAAGCSAVFFTAIVGAFLL